MTIGKSISLFLIDGATDGIVACELFNWTGKGYKIPRNKLKDLSTRRDLKKAGIYFLIGRDENDKEAMYIGEAEDVFKRLLQHQDKDFWSEAIAFVSKDDNLNKAHIKYLEYTLFNQVVEVGRYEILNTNTPNCPAISEADQAVMTEFAQNLTLLVGTLGYKMLEKLAKRSVTKQDRYYIKAARGADATAILTAEGIVVMKGSNIAQTEVPSMLSGFSNKRKDLIDSGAIEDWQFVKDYLFSSPSIAASVVMGRTANGLTEWKRKDGSTLKGNQVTE